MPRSRFIVSGLIAVATTCVAAADASNAVAVFDAYLAHAARTAPEYRADLRPVGPNESEASGRLLARGPIIGTFTFRPKTYGELSRSERADMLRDSRFRAFLALRKQADHGPAGLAAHPATRLPSTSGAGPALEQLEISPEEMLQRRAMYIVLASP